MAEERRTRNKGHGFTRIFTDQAKTGKTLIPEDPRKSGAALRNACASEKLATMVRALPAITGRRRQLAFAWRRRLLPRPRISGARPGLARVGCRRQRIYRFHDVVRSADPGTCSSQAGRSRFADDGARL